MYKICLLFFLFLTWQTAFSQSCLSDGILITKQQEIDNFVLTYPGCTLIEGEVIFTGVGTGGSDITNLNGLSHIKYMGALSINSLTNLRSLDGLNNLLSIGGDLQIKDNNKLTNIEGLKNLDSINGSLLISKNRKLTSLNGLDQLTSINGFLSINENNQLTSINGIKNIDPLTILSKESNKNDLEIYSNPLLTGCNIENICSFLTISNTQTNIFKNGSGCNSSEEISNNCPPTPPICSRLLVPADSTTNIPINPTLSWLELTNAEGYVISMGTTTGKYNIIENNDVGNLSELLIENLPCGTDIYSKITPYNSQGTPMECIETVFTTELTKAEAGDNEDLCVGKKIKLSASASIGTNYLWSSTDSLVNPTRETQNVSPDTTTQYILEVSNEGRCPTYDTVTVTVHQPPTYTIDVTPETGYNYNNGAASVLFDDNKPYSVYWDFGVGTTSISNLSPREYIIIISDIYGCFVVDSILVEEYVCPPMTVTETVSPKLCFGECNGFIDVSIEGGMAPHSVSWASGQNTPFIDSLCAGQYITTVTDAKNCPQIDTFYIDTHAEIQFKIDTIIDLYDLEPGAIHIDRPDESSTYSWTGPNGFSSKEPSIDSLIIPGHYTLVILDTLTNCKLDTTINVNSILNSNDIDKLKIKISPNPAQESIFIETGNESKIELIEFKIINHEGQTVKRINELSTLTVVSVSDLPSGFYILSMSLKNGKILNYKIVVQH